MYRQPTKIENFNRLPAKWLNFNRQPTSANLSVFSKISIADDRLPFWNSFLVDMDRTKYRLPNHAYCLPCNRYKIMKLCWLEDPNARPSFSELKIQLKKVENQHQVRFPKHETCPWSSPRFCFPSSLSVELQTCYRQYWIGSIFQRYKFELQFLWI